MVENSKNNKLQKYFGEAGIFLLSLICVYFFSKLFGNEHLVIIRNTVMCGIQGLLLIYVIEYASEKNLFDYDNGQYIFRFQILYLICLPAATAFSFLPATGWPFLVIYVLLTFFSNTLIGIISSTMLLSISVFISGEGIEVFLLYFTCGVFTSCLFKGIKDVSKAVIPVILSILYLVSALTANVILFTNETISINPFLIPMLNVFISIILLFICLKIFASSILYKYRDKYMEINDPEFILLVNLKEKSKEEYYHAVHTAYFCDRIANKLNLNADAVKASGYYLRIGILNGDNSWEKVYDITKEYHFPNEVNQILKECLDKQQVIRKKETVILVLSDAIVSSIRFLFQKNKNEKLDYDQIIDTVFKSKFDSPLLLHSDIQLNEVTQMKKIFKEERLYYDFLR